MPWRELVPVCLSEWRTFDVTEYSRSLDIPEWLGHHTTRVPQITTLCKKQIRFASRNPFPLRPTEQSVGEVTLISRWKELKCKWRSSQTVNKEWKTAYHTGRKFPPRVLLTIDNSLDTLLKNGSALIGGHWSWARMQLIGLLGIHDMYPSNLLKPFFSDNLFHSFKENTDLTPAEIGRAEVLYMIVRALCQNHLYFEWLWLILVAIKKSPAFWTPRRVVAYEWQALFCLRFSSGLTPFCLVLTSWWRENRF